MNVKLLRKVEKFLLDEPRRFDMSNWVIDSNSKLARVLKPPPCGTMCCIAGAAVVIHEKIKLNHTDLTSVFGKSMGILDLPQDQAERLFAARNWPSKFCAAYNTARTPL